MAGPFYTTFLATRATWPDPMSLVAALRTAVAPECAVLEREGTTLTLRKDTPWSESDRATAQTTIDSAPAQTVQLDAQHDIDAWPIALKALALTVLDEVNVLRAAASLAPRTPGQLINAIRTKAAQL
jgi:hypothetical protein